MKQEYINKIREACIKANPSILDLKSGCEVIRGSDFGGSPENVFIGNPYECKEVLGKSIIQVRNPWNTDDTDDLIEILGRPIQLEDVLIVMQSIKNNNSNRHWTVNRYGEFLNDALSPLPKTHCLVGKTWELGKPLHEQSEETLKFIAEII